MDVDGPLNLENFHDLEGFTCGSLVVDKWIKDHARDNSKRLNGRVCVYHRPGTNSVVGIYAVTMRTVGREYLNNAYRSRSPEEGVPAYFIGQFAVSVCLQRQGLGARMLADILKGFKYQQENTGGFPAPFIYLDAVDEVAAKFWVKNGFKHFPKINGCTYLRGTKFLQDYIYPYAL